MTNIISMAVAVILSIESSGGIDTRAGDKGKAVGPFQMWTTAVDEANRVEGIYARRFKRKPRVWKYSDRECLKKSQQMCELLLIWHYRRGVTDIINLVCRWNRPSGRVNRKYRKKVLERIKRMG